MTKLGDVWNIRGYWVICMLSRDREIIITDTSRNLVCISIQYLRFPSHKWII